MLNVISDQSHCFFQSLLVIICTSVTRSYTDSKARSCADFLPPWDKTKWHLQKWIMKSGNWPTKIWKLIWLEVKSEPLPVGTESRADHGNVSNTLDMQPGEGEDKLTDINNKSNYDKEDWDVPEELVSGKKVHIKEILGGISQLWKYKAWHFGIGCRPMIMTIHQVPEKMLPLYSKLHNNNKKPSTVETYLD